MTDTDDRGGRVLWGIRAKEEPRMLLSGGCMALGWENVGDMAALPRDRKGLKAELRRLRAEYRESDRQLGQIAAQMLRFAWEVRKGDYVAFPYPSSKDVYVGKVTGDYRYSPEGTTGIYDQRRDVRWLAPFRRDRLSVAARRPLLSQLTCWNINGAAAEEILAVAEGRAVPTRAETFAERFCGLGPTGAELFVTDLLTAMGYKAEHVGKTGDGGVDVDASIGSGFGEYKHRFRVQVKARTDAAALTEVQALHGLLEEGQVGLFVSAGGFISGAKKFIGRRGDMAALDGAALGELAARHRDALAAKWPALYA